MIPLYMLLPVEISCGPIMEVLNGQRITHIGATDGFFGMVVNYDCEDGYTASTGKGPHHVIKSFKIECKLDGCWSPMPIPKCIRKYFQLVVRFFLG